MKRILAIFRRDISSSTRDFLIVYMIIAPILLAVGLKFFIPSAASASLQFAINDKLGAEVVEEFEKYGRVEIYSSEDEIKDRVSKIDDIAGISINTEGNFKIILEGNESHDTKEIPRKIIRNIVSNEEMDVNYIVKDIGIQMSPIAWIGGISLIITAITMGGILIGLNIIEEKESKTIKALNVSPMSRLEFILGKSFIGIIIPIVDVFIILWILNMLDVNLYMILVMTLVSSIIGVIVGFLIGVTSPNQIAGIANMKVLFLVVGMSIIGAILIPQSKHFFLYWAPTYWAFMGLKGIILKTMTWAQLGVYIIWILGLTAAIFLLLKTRIRKGLT